MSLFGRLTQPLRGYRLLRRILAEQRSTRRAVERIADAVELALAPRDLAGGQAFRSFARTREPLTDPELHAATGVDYVDPRAQAEMLGVEASLREILQRDPTPDEIVAVYEGRPL